MFELKQRLSIPESRWQVNTFKTLGVMSSRLSSIGCYIKMYLLIKLIAFLRAHKRLQSQLHQNG